VTPGHRTTFDPRHRPAPHGPVDASLRAPDPQPTTPPWPMTSSAAARRQPARMSTETTDTPGIREHFAEDTLNAFESALLAQWIAFAPVVFQATKALRDMGILAAIAATREKGMTTREVVEATGHSEYAVRVLVEAALGMRLV